MKNLSITFVFIVGLSQFVNGYSIFYDKVEKRVYHGAMETKQELENPSRYVVQPIYEFSPLLKNGQYITYDLNTQEFRAMTDSEKKAVDDKARLIEIKDQMRYLKNQIKDANTDLENGFKISVSTTELQNQYDILKSEKEGLENE